MESLQNPHDVPNANQIIEIMCSAVVHLNSLYHNKLTVDTYQKFSRLLHEMKEQWIQI